MIVIDARAMSKAIAHALRRPSVACCGAFLADARALEDDDRTSSSASFEVRIVDAIPLFHSSSTSVAMMEIALEQVEAYARVRGRATIGAWSAPARRDDRDLGVRDQELMEVLQRKGHSRAFACVMNGEALEAFARGERETPFASATEEARCDDVDETRATCEAYVLGELECDVDDFDDHFDDVSRDWRNERFVRAMDEAAKKRANELASRRSADST